MPRRPTPNSTCNGVGHISWRVRVLVLSRRRHAVALYDVLLIAVP